MTIKKVVFCDLCGSIGETDDELEILHFACNDCENVYCNVDCGEDPHTCKSCEETFCSECIDENELCKWCRPDEV